MAAFPSEGRAPSTSYIAAHGDHILHSFCKIMALGHGLWTRVFVPPALLGALLFFSVDSEATSIVALIDHKNHTLVLAADCRVNRESAAVAQCKIVEEPGCIVGIAGVYQEPATQFDLRELVSAACRHPGNLRAKADIFLQLAMPPYEKAIQHSLETNPDDFHKTLENKATEVVFAGVQEGHVVLFVRGFVADSTGKVTSELYDDMDTVNPQIGYFLGLNDHIKKYVSLHKTWERIGYRRAARKFVQMEIQAHPDLARPPITEIEIDAQDKVHWITRGACVTRKSQQNPGNCPQAIRGSPSRRVSFRKG